MCTKKNNNVPKKIIVTKYQIAKHQTTKLGKYQNAAKSKIRTVRSINYKTNKDKKNGKV